MNRLTRTRLLTLSLLAAFVLAGAPPAGSNVGEIGARLQLDTIGREPGKDSKKPGKPVQPGKKIGDRKNLAASAGVVRNTGGMGLRLRDKPWGTILGNLPEGTPLTILGRQKAKGEVWYEVKAGGKRGWVHGNWVGLTGDEPSAPEPPATPPETPPATPPADDNPPAPGDGAEAGTTLYVTADALNVRDGPFGAIIGSLKRGDKVEVVAREGDWYKIKFNGGEAYVSADWVAKEKPADNGSGTAGGSSVPYDGKPYTGDLGPNWGAQICKGGHVSSEYGEDRGTWIHNGIDIATNHQNGYAVQSPGPGKVLSCGKSGNYGNLLVIQHDNGLLTYYGHLQDYAGLSAGDRVEGGQLIAHTNNNGASTGPHLHFEVRTSRYTTVNPRSIPGLTFGGA